MVISVSPTGTGYLEIHIDTRRHEFVYVPISARVDIDKGECFFPDALVASTALLRDFPGITEEFRSRFFRINHPDVERMWQVCEYTQRHLLYNLYNPNNPGHLFVAIQCYGGWWAGMASQIFASVLLQKCEEAVVAEEARRGSRAPDRDDLVMMGVVVVIGAICKGMGASCRTPLIPHLPSGTPPDPVVLLADCIIQKQRWTLTPIERTQLIKELRVWHVPEIVRRTVPDYLKMWMPHCHIDRTRAIREIQLRKNSISQ